jgi:hypothetical protein
MKKKSSNSLLLIFILTIRDPFLPELKLQKKITLKSLRHLLKNRYQPTNAS